MEKAENANGLKGNLNMNQPENFDQFKARLISSLPAGTVKIELIEFLDGHKIDNDIHEMIKLIERGDHT